MGVKLIDSQVCKGGRERRKGVVECTSVMKIKMSEAP